MGGALWLGHQLLGAPGPLEKTKNIVIPRGAGPQTMAELLQEEGVIDHPRLFRIALLVDPTPKPIKAGEYEMPAHISMPALLDLLQSGKQVQRRLTVAEGMTTAEVIDLVQEHAGAVGRGHARRQGRRPAAGDLLLFARRHARRRAAAHEGGDGQDAGRGVAQARRRPAASQPPRGADPGLDHREGDGGPGRAAEGGGGLRQSPAPGMRLESDPTTIYGLTGGKGSSAAS